MYQLEQLETSVSFTDFTVQVKTVSLFSVTKRSPKDTFRKTECFCILFLKNGEQTSKQSMEQVMILSLKNPHAKNIQEKKPA